MSYEIRASYTNDTTETGLDRNNWCKEPHN